MSADTTIMMITYNRLHLTKSTLESLAKTIGRDFNLVIIDNNSQDGTIDFLKDFENNFNSNFLKDIKITFNNVNKGIAVGRNQALKIADTLKTKWYAYADNDQLFPDNWLNECIEILTLNKEYGSCGVNLEDVTYPVVEKNGKKFQEKPRGNLGSGCMVFPNTLHKMLGFFNTEYGLYGEEDADWGMRTRMLNFKLAYILENGKHLGVGEHDTGEYREWKTASHKRNLSKFNEACRLYASGNKNLYIPYKE